MVTPHVCFVATIFPSWHARVVYFSVVAIVLFLLARKGRAQAEAALQAEVVTGYGPAISLRDCARAFWNCLTARTLLLGTIFVWASRIAAGSFQWADLVIVLAVFAFWPLQEWLIHVLFLHRPAFTFFGRRHELLVSLTHRVHHRDPWSTETALNPPYVVAFYFLILPMVWGPFLPQAQGLTGVAIYLSMLLNYEWMHFLMHTSYIPKSRYYRRLWLNHRLHHHKNEQYWFGVTRLEGDALLGTDPPMRTAPRSGNCLNLAGEEFGSAGLDPAELDKADLH